MKISKKIYLTTFVNLGLIAVIGMFAIFSFNQISTKFKFTIIADKLNASFLEMRLLEKNYFLYNDKGGLLEIQQKARETSVTLNKMRGDIVKAVGRDKFLQMQKLLQDYSKMVALGIKNNKKDAWTKKEIRLVGQKLKSYSENVTALERQHVWEIITKTSMVMRHSLWIIMIFAFFFSLFIVRSIRQPLHRIVALTKTISKGNFQKIKAKPPANEMGAVIIAINSMAEELSKREKAIVQSRRLASIGVLVAGVAHELNNPLNNIAIIAQTYSEVYDKLDKEQHIGFMAQVEEQVERLQKIIKNLLDFSKPKEPKLAEKDLNEVFMHSLELVQNVMTVANVQTRLQLADTLPTIYIDEHQFQQVLVNMMINATQAMSSGGELIVKTGYIKDKDAVEISITDTGNGIAPEFLDHIFDPFFSTKEDSGTGLGLWVSYGIVKTHKGRIKVKSTIGQGTTFTIIMPTSKKYKEEANEQV
ncbi:MAG TPA: HAMP domain-containing protein [Desulfobacterales bacterium]|nr:HAMP domain-containing protein [Desulfobacterales bacterium]